MPSQMETNIYENVIVTDQETVCSAFPIGEKSDGNKSYSRVGDSNDKSPKLSQRATQSERQYLGSFIFNGQ